MKWNRWSVQLHCIIEKDGQEHSKTVKGKFELQTNSLHNMELPNTYKDNQSTSYHVNIANRITLLIILNSTDSEHVAERARHE